MNYERRSGTKRRNMVARRVGVEPGGYSGPEKRDVRDRRTHADRRREKSADPMDFAVS